MKSYEINYSKVKPGVYKRSVSGLVTTWDVRVKYPNSDETLSPSIIHTIEHTLEYYLKNKYGEYRILGVFPMGNQTGFHVLTRFIDNGQIYRAIVDYTFYLRDLKTVNGANPMECSNYKLHNLSGAQREMNRYLSMYLSSYHSAINYVK